MSVKKRITLRDILAHIQGLRNELTDRFDGVESRLEKVENKLSGVEFRLDRIDATLKPSFERLQITVRDHGGRIRALEAVRR